MSLMILELLCPKGHMVAGLVFSPESTTEEKAKETVVNLQRKTNGGREPFCPLCLTGKLEFKCAPSAFLDIARAMLPLARKAESNARRINERRQAARFN